MQSYGWKRQTLRGYIIVKLLDWGWQPWAPRYLVHYRRYYIPTVACVVLVILNGRAMLSFSVQGSVTADVVWLYAAEVCRLLGAAVWAVYLVVCE